MNILNLLSLIGGNNPAQTLLSMLSPGQKQQVETFKGKTTEQQAQEVADYCNKNNIGKDQLQSIINLFNKR